MNRMHDAIIVGAGHNGLVAAAMLARAGRSVLVLEASDTVGGACRTERPFERAPGLGCSTGAYLLGPMPPEVVEATGLEVRTMQRRPHGYYVDPDGQPVAFGIGARGLANLSHADRCAMANLDVAIATIRDDLAPAWLCEACTLDESFSLVRDEAFAPGMALTARDAYRSLATEPIRAWLARFGFESDLLAAVIAADAFIGSDAGPDTPGAGLNFLAHNMLRLPSSDSLPGDRCAPLGAWQLVEGGMGEVTRGLARSAIEAGAEVRTNARVASIEARRPRGARVRLGSGEAFECGTCVLSTDPYRAAELLGPALDSGVRERLDAARTPATSLKVNLALSRFPRVEGEERVGSPIRALSGTVHVLPPTNCFARLEGARQAALSGGVPDPDDVLIDVYTHTAVDPSLCDAQWRHAMSFFVQWAPQEMTQAQAEDFAWALIRGPVSRTLPDLAECVEEVMALPPRAIEGRFGITTGHIHHLDNRFAFEKRLPARAGPAGVYLASAGCHPAGSVIGAAGYIAAGLALE